MKKKQKNIDNIYITIKELRKKRKISQVDMSKKLGMHQAGYSQLEQGKTKIRIERLRQIAEILNVSPAIFLNDNVRKFEYMQFELMEAMSDIQQSHKSVDEVLEDPDETPETKSSIYRDKLVIYQIREIAELREILSEIYLAKNINKVLKPALSERIKKAVANSYN